MKKEHVPTPDEIWKILKEVSLNQKETDRRMQETDRRMQESKAETDRLIRESKAETDRLIRENKQEADRRKQEADCRKQETDRRIKENDQLIRESKAETERQIKENRLFIKQIDSRWGNQWGILVEAMTEGSLIQVFKDRGIDVQRTVTNHRGAYQKVEREFDVIAIDGRELVVVEAKSHFIQENVDYFLKTLKDFKKYCPEFSPWVVYGGIACLRKNKKLFAYAEKKGLFVLRVQGKNAIMLNKKSFKPEVFGPKPISNSQ